MIFNTIQNFIQFNSLCPICENNMVPLLRVDNLENIYPDENPTIKQIDQEINNEYILSGQFYNYAKKSCYLSRIDSSNRLYLSYFFSGAFKEKICSIDIESNKNFDSVKKLQYFFTKFSIRIGNSCYRQECLKQLAYYYNSDKLYVDIKNNKIYPTKLEQQICGLSLDGEYYMLQSSQNKTILTTKTKLVGEFPIVDLQKIRGYDNFVKKVKTLLVFG